jgi:predicted DNA-binding transcriptional regulator YafY
VQAYCFTAQGYRTFRGERIRDVESKSEKVDHSQATRSNSEVALLVNLKVKISSHLREVKEKFA